MIKRIFARDISNTRELCNFISRQRGKKHKASVNDVKEILMMIRLALEYPNVQHFMLPKTLGW